MTLRKVVFRTDQKDMPRPDRCPAREEWYADAVQVAAVTPVLRMKVLLLFSQLALLTPTLCVEKVRLE